MKITTDKVNHFIACVALAMVVAVIFAHFAPTATSCAAGFVAAFAAGIGKECGDRAHGGKFDKHDLLADLAGAAVGCLAGFVHCLI